MTEQIWLLDEGVPPNNEMLQKMERKARPLFRGIEAPEIKAPILAARIQDIVIHDNKKWFGGSDLRLDVLVVHGYDKSDKPNNFYMPGTFRFPGVKDGERLPTGEKGLLIFHGETQFFLDIFITVSRDKKDSDELANILSKASQSEEMKGALSPLFGLAVAAPTATIIASALRAAVTMGDLAYKILRQVTGETVGLYRTSWLQHRDRFGVGRHPEVGTHSVKDLSFWYEIIDET